MVGVSELKGQHAVIRVAARHLLDVAVVGRGYRAAAPGLLNDLAEAVAAHGKVDEGHVRAREPDLAARDRLASAWTDYLTTWDVSRIAMDWSGFAAATHVILPAVLARLDVEDAWLDAEAPAG